MRTLPVVFVLLFPFFALAEDSEQTATKAALKADAPKQSPDKPQRRKAAAPRTIKGTWTNISFQRAGRKYADPRSSLEISFNDDGTFLWKSVETQEVWIENTDTGERQTRVRKIERELKGNYSTSDEIITFTLSSRPKAGDLAIAALALGYDVGKKKGKVNFRFEKDNLVLSVPSGKKTIYVFKKNPRPPNKPDDFTMIGIESLPQGWGLAQRTLTPNGKIRGGHLSGGPKATRVFESVEDCKASDLKTVRVLVAKIKMLKAEETKSLLPDRDKQGYKRVSISCEGGKTLYFTKKWGEKFEDGNVQAVWDILSKYKAGAW